MSPDGSAAVNQAALRRAKVRALAAFYWADGDTGVFTDADLWLVVPQKDDHPSARRLAGNLAHPAQVVPVPDTWRTLT